MKKKNFTLVSFFTILFLMVFLSAGAAPDKPKNNMKKDIKIRNEVKVKKLECKCPQKKDYKKLTGYNKVLNRSWRVN